jgi:hypothetical protein
VAREVATGASLGLGVGLAQLHRNSGTFGIVRAVAVLGVFVWIVVRTYTGLGSWLPLASFAIGIAIPVLLRRMLVDHVDQVSAPLQWFSYVLIGGAALSPLWFDLVPKQGWIAEAFLVTLSFLVALYMSAWLSLLSHPDITTARARRG